MEILKGLFPLLFASINLFLLINLLIFGKETSNKIPVLLLLTSLFLSQISEFLICFFLVDYQVLKLIAIMGVWLAPVFAVIFLLLITGMPKKIVNYFYFLILALIMLLAMNYGNYDTTCSLLAMTGFYSSKWLWSYISFLFLIIGAIRINIGFKNLNDKVEILKRRILLFSIILTMLSAGIFTLIAGSGTAYLESIMAKTFIFISIGESFYIIREKYNER